MKTKEVDPLEKKRRVENYRAFMNRGGPDAPGSKQIPDGAPNCLKNLTFVISGKLINLILIKIYIVICFDFCLLKVYLSR